MNRELLHAAVLLLGVLAAVAVAIFVTLVVLRVSRMALERREIRRRELIRAALFEVLMGDGEEAADARAQMLARSGRAWAMVEAQAFEMLPKIKGDARAALVELVRSRGAAEHARRSAHAFSAVRRCRGAFALGALGETEALPRLIELLEDRSFLVRRTAVRALGSLGDSRAVRPLLDLVGQQSRLSRDLVHALYRIGPDGAAELRAEVKTGISSGPDPRIHAEVAATVLGLIDDVPSVAILARGLESPRPGLAVACAEALGRIGSPEAMPDLVEALNSGPSALRVAAAHALGDLGSEVAVGRLVEAVDEQDPAVSRQAAESLRRIGAPGMAALAGSTSPYAVEVLALQAIRETR